MIGSVWKSLLKYTRKPPESNHGEDILQLAGQYNICAKRVITMSNVRITHYCPEDSVGQLEAEWDEDSMEYRSKAKCPDCETYVYGNENGVEHA